MQEQSARVRFTRSKRSGGSHWHRSPCVVADCRRAARLGSLCEECQPLVLIDVAGDLGFSPDAVAVGSHTGYVTFRRFNRGEWLIVHRVVMERALGRALLPGENVHHINGDRADNRIDNLELWVTAQPAGQRPDDLAAHARALLARYGTPAEQATYRG